MYYINYIDFFSIDANLCAQKHLKRTSPGFDSVKLLTLIINYKNENHTQKKTKTLFLSVCVILSYFQYAE